MLKAILMVTVMVGEPSEVSDIYQATLNYEEVTSGQVGAVLAASWNAPEVADNAYELLQPESQEPVYLRFVHTPDQGNYQPLKTEGWNAIEILVEDPDALNKKLEASPHFDVIGQPNYLTDKKLIKAMQAIGPSNELLYFTRIASSDSSGFGLMPATAPVDRVFIMVLAAKDRVAIDNYYKNTLGMPVNGPYDYRVSVLSNAWGLPADTLYPLTIVPLSRRFLLELDDYPDAVAPRAPTQEGMPGGIAMVTFLVDDINQYRDHWLGIPAAHDGPPYNGRRSVVLKGAAGEYIELVEDPPTK
ncbi:MAG: VOC family protein [Lysobacterales bacterium]